MAVVPLTKDEIKQMRRVCQLAAHTLDYVEKFVKPGISTLELDQIVEDFTKAKGARSAPLGYHGFPKSICTSVNTIVCHGVPDAGTILNEGDIVNVDVTPFLDGFFGDSSRTFMVGSVSSRAADIVKAAKEAMEIGIVAIRAGGYTEDIGFEINKYVTRKGYSTVKEIGGHGIGKVFHQDPFVPSFGKKGRGSKLIAGQCITVEPMVNEGTDEVIELNIAGSTVKYYKTADNLLSAQFEHTVLVTDAGYEILTLPD